jgi:two-component system sensor histidine kinase BaeS
VVGGAPPEGVTLGPADLAGLLEGRTVSGRQDRLVYAAAPIDLRAGVGVVILTDTPTIALGGSAVWFVLAAGGVLVVAVLIAGRLARTLTEPLRRADEASRRIAAGDLSARVPDPPPGAADEVADLSRSINAMAGALERSRGLDQQFLLSVSHDLRTPLTSIQGYAEALADGTVADARRAAGVILTESGRLERLVRDLLQLARLDARGFTLERVPVELHELAAACADGFAPEAEAAGVTIDVAAVPAEVVADPDRLAQVVANLLENALKFAQGRIQVDVTTDDGWARVTVTDDGPGIDAADREHVFERLYVARHVPARKESGSGLGLAIVRELVSAMGGTVGVGDGAAGGQLWFALPLAPEATGG